MAIIKCKMCGGELEITQGTTVAECEYCGTKQTLPRLDDDRKANLYDRANHFRRNNEFDKAMGIYEQILNEDGADAEAYWSLVLCRYGIEYVEDPASHKRIPTINRAQFTSIFDDDNYKSALQYADKYQKDIYEAEAKAINEIQKRILAISEKEEPFDVFVCYKETDNSGRRTPDSVLAQELYYQLTQEGFKVFFSRITLEDKLGSAYEPYIFAALNSAKVMVVLGTKPEHFKAVWVRNEWSRYLSLIKSGAKKTLIPAYKDMDPYDLPEEFSHLQAQDMSKLGFMQDLLRGIKKIIGAEDKKTTVIKETVVSSGNTNTASLLKRAFLFLEDGDWNSADEYCEKVLDVDPECSEAYLGKLMVELRVKRQDDLKDQAEPFDDNSNYQKAMRFADGALKTALVGYIKHIRECKEAARLDGIYSEAQKTMSNAKTEKECIKAAHLFESIDDYKDSTLLAQECLKQAEIFKEAAIKDARLRKRVGIILGIIGAILGLTAVFIYICDTVIIPNSKYNGAVELMNEGKYTEAISAFEALEGYKDSVDKIKVCTLEGKYIEAITLMDKGEYTEAISAFQALDGYKDSQEKITQCEVAIQAAKDKEQAALMEGQYTDAIALMEAGNVVEAYEALIALSSYKDSAEKANSIYEDYKAEKLKNVKVDDYVFFGSYEQDNNVDNGKEPIEWLVLEIRDNRALVISKYALDQVFYTETDPYTVTWETCTLRKWLNDSFINTAFSTTEKTVIPTTTILAELPPDAYDVDVGSDTQDKVFLLNYFEAYKYFTSNSNRQCVPTDYAVSRGAWKDVTGCTAWWLRSPGCAQEVVGVIETQGDVSQALLLYRFESDDYDAHIGVRPAMWIDLSKI